MVKPQILVFIDWYSPGFKAGGPVRSMMNLVDHLRDTIDFNIVTSDTDYTADIPYPGITADRWTTLPGGEKVWFASRSGIKRASWRRILKQRKWDVVYINGIYSYWFSILPLLLSGGMRRVVAVRGMLAEGPMRHGRMKKEYFIHAMKLLGFYRNVEFQATNGNEVEEVKKWIGRDAIIHLVPNVPRKLAVVPPPARRKRAGELRLVSAARIAVEKNTLFAIECLNGVNGEVTLDLYGPIYDGAFWELCQAAIAALPSNIAVSHKGSIVPDQVPAMLDGYHALYMPSQGENFGHTMLESLAAGLPLVISDRTPWCDLRSNNAGWDLSLNDPQLFTAAVQELVDMDAEQYTMLSQGAFALGARYLADPIPVEKSLALFTP